MYEIIVKDENDFNELSTLADYSSKLTGVISINSDKILEVRSRFPNTFNKYIKKDYDEILKAHNENKTTAYWNKNSVWLKGAPSDILCYLEVWTEYKPIVKWASFGRFLELVSQGLIELDDELKEKLGPINKDTKVTDMLTSVMKVKKHYDKVNWSFAKGYPDNLISELNIEDFPVKRNPVMILRNLIVTGVNAEKREFYLYSPEKDSKYTARFYKLQPAITRTLVEGKEVSMIVSKVVGSKERGYFINQPIIVPSNFKVKYIECAKPSRLIPSENFNALRSEYLFRKKLK